MQSLQKFQINYATRSIILDNGQSCVYDPYTNELNINEEPYVLFEFPTTLRHHKTILNYTDELHYYYAMIPCKIADTFLELVAGLCSPHILLPVVPEENRKGLVDFIEYLKEFSLGTVTTSGLLELLDHIMEIIPSDLYNEFLNFKKQTRTVFLKIPETETRSNTMTLVCHFLGKYISYDESLLNFHSTTVTPYIVYSALTIFYFLHSAYDSKFPLNLVALTSHTTMSMFIDIITDRWGTELVINGKNTSLQITYQNLKNTCRALTLPSTQWNEAMIDEVKYKLDQEELMCLYPHVLYYHLSEKERFNKTLTVIKDALKNNQMKFDTSSLHAVFKVDEIINQCNEIVSPLSKNASLYTTHSIIKLLDSSIIQAFMKIKSKD